MKRQSHWVPLAVALIGLAGSVIAAYITAGNAFDNKLEVLQDQVDNLEVQSNALSKNLASARGELLRMSTLASRLETRLGAIDKASFPLADTVLGTVRLDHSVITREGYIKAFVATGASSPLVMATLHEGDYNQQVTVFAGVRVYGGQPGILLSVYPSSGLRFPSSLNLDLTVLQQGAKSYAPAILYAGN